MHCKVIAAIIIALFLYIVIGGAVFWSLESRYVAKTQQEQKTSATVTSTSSVNYVAVEFELIDFIYDEVDRKNIQQSSSGTSNKKIHKLATFCAAF